MTYFEKITKDIDSLAKAIVHNKRMQNIDEKWKIYWTFCHDGEDYATNFWYEEDAIEAAKNYLLKNII